MGKETEDLTGQRFGKLVVLSKAPSKNGYTAYLVRCDCGREKVVLAHNLKRGMTKSCGYCYKLAPDFHADKRKNLIGQRFGRLVVVEDLGHKKVRCHCDCGNDHITSKSSLTKGATISCGCAMKEAARNAAKMFLHEGTNIARIKSDKPTQRSKSGVRGVCWNERRQKWRANIGFKGQKYDLGSFDSFEEAVAARKAAEEKYFKPIIT